MQKSAQEVTQHEFPKPVSEEESDQSLTQEATRGASESKPAHRYSFSPSLAFSPQLRPHKKPKSLKDLLEEVDIDFPELKLPPLSLSGLSPLPEAVKEDVTEDSYVSVRSNINRRQRKRRRPNIISESVKTILGNKGT